MKKKKSEFNLGYTKIELAQLILFILIGVMLSAVGIGIVLGVII